MLTPEQSRLLNSTIADYIRDREIAILRNRKLLALMKSRGRITFNHGGTHMDWKVKYKRVPIQTFSEQDVLSFTQSDRNKSAMLPWRGYAATDAITKLQSLKNKGPEAIVKLMDEIVPGLMDDIEENFSDELYVDGYAAGNEKRIMGLESFFGISGAAAAGYVGVNDDTYAELDTALGSYGGNWDEDGSGNVIWPTGTGDPEYDFWTPLVMLYDDANWSAATDNWKNNCREVIRYGISKGRKNKSVSSKLDCVFIEEELHRQFLDQLSTNERIVFQANNGAKPTLTSLGFNDVVLFDGVEITTEYGIPVDVGYGIPIDDMELCSLQPQLFVSNGPDFNMETQSWRYSVDFYGQLKISQLRHFLKFRKTP